MIVCVFVCLFACMVNFVGAWSISFPRLALVVAVSEHLIMTYKVSVNVSPVTSRPYIYLCVCAIRLVLRESSSAISVPPRSQI